MSTLVRARFSRWNLLGALAAAAVIGACGETTAIDGGASSDRHPSRSAADDAATSDAIGSLSADLGASFDAIVNAAGDAARNPRSELAHKPGEISFVEVPDRVAGPEVGAPLAILPYEVVADARPLEGTHAPLDWPLTDGLTPSLAARQIAVDPASAEHPDLGLRAPADPVDSFEVLSLRTETSRILELPDGKRLYAAFGGPAFSRDRAGFLRNNVLRFAASPRGVEVRSQSGAAATLPAHIAEGIALSLTEGGEPTTLLAGLRAVAHTANGAVRMRLPSSSPEAFDTFARYWDNNADAGLRVDGGHNSLQWSMTLGERWVRALPQGATRVTLEHEVHLPKGISLDTTGRPDGGFDTCEPVTLRDDAGNGFLTISGVRIWDANAIAVGAAVSGCPETITQRFEQRGDTLLVTVSIDPAWLAAADRTFPIVIDPDYTWTSASGQNIFGTVYSQAIYNGTAPALGNMEWGDHDARRGFAAWPLNNFPTDGWALLTQREATISGHRTASNSTMQGSSVRSHVEFRFLNFFSDGSWRAATYAAGNTTRGTALYNSFLSDAWHISPVGGSPPTPTTWNTLCSGAGCTNNIVLNEVEPNELYAQGGAAMLGAQQGASVCSNTCGTASNGVCQDGGPAYRQSGCAYGTDCTDCGPRTPLNLLFQGELTSNDLDTFGVQTTYPPTFRIWVETVDGSPCTLDSVLELRIAGETMVRKDGVCPSINTCENNPTWSCSLLSEGAYGVTLRGYAPFDTGNYRVRVEVDRNPATWAGLYGNARWRIGTTFGDNPVNVLTANNNQPYINEMWRNGSRGNVGTYWNSNDAWYAVTRRADTTTYPVFTITYAQPVLVAPGNFTWVTRAHNAIRWEWNHAQNARWYELVQPAGSGASLVASNLFRFYEITPGVYRYYVDETGLTENTCYVRSARGDNEIGEGPAAPWDQVATLARSPVVPTAPTATDGDFTVATNLMEATLNFSYLMPGLGTAGGCDDVINHSEIQARLVSCSTGVPFPSTQASTTTGSVVLTSTESCGHIEVRYVNIDGIPTSWVRTNFQVAFSQGLSVPGAFQVASRGVQNITWSWVDTSSTETSFVLTDENNATRRTQSSTTTATTGTNYTWNETSTSGADGNLPRTRRVRARNASLVGPDTEYITAYTLSRTPAMAPGTDHAWTGSDAIVYNLVPAGGGSYTAHVVIAEQPNNGTAGCSGAVLTRCRLVAGVETECVTVAAGTQSDTAANGACASPVANGNFDGRGYGVRYDGGELVSGEGLFVGRAEGIVYDSGLTYGETYTYSLRYVNADDHPGAAVSFTLPVGCCYDADAAPSYHGAGGSCLGVCSTAVQGLFLTCTQPGTFGSDENCDGLDNDCNGTEDDVSTAWYRDADADGYGDPATSQNACASPGAGWIDVGGDCNDLDPSVNPTSLDICDGIDNDCNAASNDGSSDGALGAACATGVPGACGPGQTTCGGAGSYTADLMNVAAKADWTIYDTDDRWYWADTTLPTHGQGWRVRGNRTHDTRVVISPWAVNAFNAELEFINSDSERDGSMGIAFDLAGKTTYAFAQFSLNLTAASGDERITIGRANNGTISTLATLNAPAVASGERVRMRIQMHNGVVKVWLRNVTTGGPLVYVGQGDVGAATQPRVGVIGHRVSLGMFHAFSVYGANIACESVIEPGDLTETCNGVDDDCDGTLDDGFGVGLACDGGDSDMCVDGIAVCNATGTGTYCEDRSPYFIWNFEELSGGNAYDDSGAGNTGTVTGGAVYTTSSMYGGGALELSGNNGYVVAPVNLDEDRFTLSAWFRTTATSGGILSVTNGVSPSASVHDRHIYVTSGRIAYRVLNGTASRCTNGPLVNDGNWHHTAITCEKGVACRLYLDGVQVCGTTTYDSTYSNLTAQTHVIVGHSQLVGRFNGQIDQVAAFPYAMSATSVMSMRNAGVFEPALGANREICDGVDNDCDGEIDPGGVSTYYRDNDGDTYGDPAYPTTLCATDPAVLGGGWVQNNLDCNDAAFNVNPDASEIVGDEVDQNCDGAELCYRDNDRDQARTWQVVGSTDLMCRVGEQLARHNRPIDCDDDDATVFPEALELCDGIDNDCDGEVDEGFASTIDDLVQPGSSCGVGEAIPATSRLQDIFNQRHEQISASLDASVTPETFMPTEGTLTFHFVAEGAGYENMFGWYNAGTDVNNPANRFPIFVCNEEPSASMIRSVTFDATNTNWLGGPIGFYITTPQGRPNNCANNTDYGYAYYTELSLNTGDLLCTDQPFLHYLVYKSTAYDESYYFGFEDLYRGGDNDFEDVLVMVEGLVGENEWYRDADLDGHGDAGDVEVACTQPDGYVPDDQDCNDATPRVRPGARELCDGMDNNCANALDDEGVDVDDDGTTTCGGDCDDDDASQNVNDDDDDTYDTCGSYYVNGVAQLHTVDVGVIGDAYVRSTSDAPWGNDNSLAVGNASNSDPTRTLIAFDLSEIPAGTRIIRAEMFMYAYSRWDGAPGTIQPKDRSIAAHRVLRPWTEDLVTAADTGDADGTQWSETRLATNDTDASRQVADMALVQAGLATFPVGWSAWDITAEVEAWLAGEPNYGVVLSANNETAEGYDVRFYSSEFGDPARRPYLRITLNGSPELVDCDDVDPEINPGATEICDGIDNNCTGYIDDDEPGFVDFDADGFSVCDCDDDNNVIFPGAPPLCDYQANDCNALGASDDAEFNLGAACDGSDPDSCSDGVRVCDNDLITATCSDGAGAIYRAEEGAGTTPFDWAGNGAAGTMIGAAAYSVHAKYGGSAFDFPIASTGGVRMPAANAGGLEFTAAAWVRREAAGTRVIVSRTADVGVAGLVLATDGTLQFGGMPYNDAAIAVPSGTWTHVAVSFDRRNLRVYLNGVLAKNVAVPTNAQPTEWRSDVWFGQYQSADNTAGPTSNAFVGRMDDIAWYNHALSAAQVSALMNGNIAGDLNAEVCDGLDNNCSGTVDDGFAVAQSCDGADADACLDGVSICTANGLATMCGDGAGGLYNLNDDLGDGAFDRSGNNRAALVNGAAASATIGGRTGVSLPGDGASALRVPGTVASAPQFSFAAWVYPSGLGGTQYIANIATQKSASCSYNGFSLTRDGQLGLNCQTVSVPALAFAANTWTHVAATFDGAALRVYRNGSSTPAYTWNVCDGSSMADCAAEYRALTWTSHLWIGQEQDVLNGGFSGARAFHGYVDDVAWFNYALPAADAAALATGFDGDDVNFELCDGADNDCQGGADDPYAALLGNECSVGVGACRATGYYICAVDGLGATCDATPGTPSAEVCDDIDNDCDGLSDEDDTGANMTEACYSGPAGTAGVGVCTEGTRMCVSGAWSACMGEVTPQAETCDGEDNDCNGSVDRVAGGAAYVSQSCYSGPSGTAGRGECRAGVQTCTDDGTWGSCAGEVTPQAETCDNRDNDCDGTSDQFAEPCYSGPAGTADVGACRTGARTCTAGAWGTCGGQVTPAAEICSISGDEDMNCDGAGDDNCVDVSLEILGIASGDPGTDYTQCDVTDGDPTSCTFLRVRLTNGGTVPLGAGAPVEVRLSTGELVSGPFPLPATVAPSESLELAYCFNSDRGRNNVTVRVLADFGDGNVAEDSMAGQSLAACGFEVCDGFDNDGDGRVDEHPEACGSTMQCIRALDDEFKCVALLTADESCEAEGTCASSPDCSADADCAAGEFCSNGHCVFSGRWTAEPAAPTQAELVPEVAAAEDASRDESGCSAARQRPVTPWAALVVLGLVALRRRRD